MAGFVMILLVLALVYAALALPLGLCKLIERRLRPQPPERTHDIDDHSRHYGYVKIDWRLFVAAFAMIAIYALLAVWGTRIPIPLLLGTSVGIGCVLGVVHLVWSLRHPPQAITKGS